MYKIESNKLTAKRNLLKSQQNKKKKIINTCKKKENINPKTKYEFQLKF